MAGKRKSEEMKTLEWLLYEMKDMPRSLRVHMVDSYIDFCFEVDGKMPSEADLSILADDLLREELNDPDKYKSQRVEYNFHSEEQMKERLRMELTGVPTFTKATDGKDYRRPVRRPLSRYEQEFIDREREAKEAEEANVPRETIGETTSEAEGESA